MEVTKQAGLVLVIGNKNLSSWSMRPWLVLTQAGIPFTERVLPFETDGWRDTIVTLSPSKLVPVLERGKLVVWDSLAICEYVADAFPEARLWPTNPALRAVARAVSAEMHSGFANMRRTMSMDVAARHPGNRMSSETQDDVERIQALWSECRGRAAKLHDDEAGPFLFGRFSIADAMFAPVVWRFQTYDVTVSRGAREYYETMLALPTMQRWHREAVAEVEALGERAALARSSPHRAPDPRSAQHCYAVIFSSQRASRSRSLCGAESREEYERSASAMVELAAQQPGFLGVESARGEDGFGITVSYWDSLEAIRAWKDVPAHALVQARGKESFYDRYEVRVCVVERGYKYPTSSTDEDDHGTIRRQG
jgi:glutathione S-transferase